MIMSQQIILNGRTSNIAPNEPLRINRTARFIPPNINGLMQTDISINGLTRRPTLAGCVLDLPLYLPTKQASPFTSVDNNAHVCTVTGAIWTPQGRTFGGTDDVINCGSATSLDALTGNMTVSAWVNPTSVGENNYGRILDKTTINFEISPGNRSLFSLTVGAVGKYAQGAVNSLPLGSWSHVVGVFNGTNVLIYTNLTLVTGSATEGPVDAHSAVDLRIGDNAASNSSFDGLIGEVRVYDQIAFNQLDVGRDFQLTQWRYR